MGLLFAYCGLLNTSSSSVSSRGVRKEMESYY